VLDHPVLPEWALGSTYGGIPASSRRPRSCGRVRRRARRPWRPALAVDSGAAADWLPPGRRLRRLAAGRHGFAGSCADVAHAAAARRPERLAVTLDTGLVDSARPAATGEITSPPSVYVSVVLSDSNGLHRFDGGDVALSSASGVATIELTSTVVGATYGGLPALTRGDRDRVSAPAPSQLDGTIELKAWRRARRRAVATGSQSI